MRIVTWNVLGLTGYPPAAAAADIGHPGDEHNTAHFADVIASLEADVVALQEGVAQGTARDLAQRLDLHLASLPSPMHWPGHVLSRFPVDESRTFSHAMPGGMLPPFSRTCGAALLRVTHTARLWIVCVHLHPSDAAMRRREGDLLRERLEGLLAGCADAVVLGDFNCDVSEPVHGRLRGLGFVNAMATAGGGLRPTMDTARTQPWTIDHVYVSPSLAPCLSSAAVVRDPGFRTDAPRPEGAWDHSDHLPVSADLAWP